MYVHLCVFMMFTLVGLEGMCLSVGGTMAGVGRVFWELSRTLRLCVTGTSVVARSFIINIDNEKYESIKFLFNDINVYKSFEIYYYYYYYLYKKFNLI